MGLLKVARGARASFRDTLNHLYRGVVLVDGSGEHVGIPDNPALNHDFVMKVRIGGVPGWGVTSMVGSGFIGQNETSLADLETPGVLSLITTPTTLAVASTDPEDRLFGSGMNVIGIFGLDAVGNEIVSVVFMNGLTPVVVPIVHSFINGCLGISAGFPPGVTQNLGYINIGLGSDAFNGAGTPVGPIFSVMAPSSGIAKNGILKFPLGVTGLPLHAPGAATRGNSARVRVHFGSGPIPGIGPGPFPEVSQGPVHYGELVSSLGFQTTSGPELTTSRLTCRGSGGQLQEVNVALEFLTVINELIG